jgi:hypothetical protein
MPHFSHLSIKTARFIDMNYSLCDDLRSCDDEYIAYINKEKHLILYHIASRQKQTLTNHFDRVQYAQIFKGSLYFGNYDDFTVAKLNDIENTKQKSKVPVCDIVATADVFIANIVKRELIIVEAWKKDFEVVWDYYGIMRVFGDKVVLTNQTNEAVIIDLKSNITTTVIAEGIGQIETGYAEIEPNKITLNTLNGSQLFELKPNWKYWLSLGSGVLYYFDVGIDLVLLATYLSTELYLIFALSLVLIITPNIVEVIENKQRTLKSSLAQLLFVEHFLALVRDYKNPTYLNGSRTTGKELSRRTTIETGIESIPQSLISLYFIFSTENYTVVPILSLAVSMLSASLATSFGLKLAKPDAFLGCLFCYRFCEILVRVMILALCSTYIYPYFAILFIASSIVIHFLFYSCINTKECIWLYWLTSSAINSFAFVNGIPTLKNEFITKGDSDGVSFFNLIYSHFINVVLIIILQFQYEVSYILSAFMWALCAMRIALYAMMLLSEQCIPIYDDEEQYKLQHQLS